MKSQLVFAVLLLWATIDKSVIGAKKRSKSGEDRVVVSANNEFAFNIFNTLVKSDSEIISPLSILSAFSILMNGANGTTLDDLIQFLKYNHTNDSESDLKAINAGFQIISGKYGENVAEDQKHTSRNHVLNVANRVINSKEIDLLDDFVVTASESYGAEVEAVDIANNAVKETAKVNEWVGKHTNNKIKKIFDKIDDKTTLIILNAIYFKGTWVTQFNIDQTKQRVFYNGDGLVKKVYMMTKTAYYNYMSSSDLNAQILELPFVDLQTSMVIVLPNERDGLQELRQNITAQIFEASLNELTKQYVQIFIPRFRTEKSYDLMKDLSPQPLALTKEADYSRLTLTDKQIVSEVIHKTFVAVDEYGAEAAAVTAITMTRRSAVAKSPNPIVFNADHPFLYFIRDNTNGLIVFYGQISEF